MLILCQVWSEQSASCFICIYCDNFLSRQKLEVVWLYVFHGCTLACVCSCDGDVICVDHDLNRCSGCWYVCCVNVK